MEAHAHTDHSHPQTTQEGGRSTTQQAQTVLHDQAAKASGTPLRIGVGGPVGAGKTALIYRLCQTLAPIVPIGVVTNDIYTREDAAFLARHSALPSSRVIGVETGGCPHAAVRDDVSANLDAIDDLLRASSELQLVLLESGGDNLSATFSPDLVERTIYVIDVAAGDKIPRKRGLGMMQADLLIVNKIDLAPYVGANLEVMARDAAAVRGNRPTVFTNLQDGTGLEEALSHIHRWLAAANLQMSRSLEDAGRIAGALPRWT